MQTFPRAEVASSPSRCTNLLIKLHAGLVYTPFTRRSWLDKLARSASIYSCSMFVWWLLRVSYAICMFHICSMFARSCKRGITALWRSVCSRTICRYRWTDVSLPYLSNGRAIDQGRHLGGAQGFMIPVFLCKLYLWLNVKQQFEIDFKHYDLITMMLFTLLHFVFFFAVLH